MSIEYSTKEPISQSKRLRQVLFLLFKQNNVAGNFEDFYSAQMEVTIENFKSQLVEKGKES